MVEAGLDSGIIINETRKEQKVGTGDNESNKIE